MADSTTMAQATQRATERLRDEVGVTDQRLRELLHEYPLTALLAALASGYLMGRLVGRR